MVLRLVTWNLWGRGAPKPYVEERGIVRGAVPGSAALAEADPERTWSRRLPLLVGELADRVPDVVLLQECGVHDAGHAATLVGERLGYDVVLGAPHPGGLAALTRVPRRRAGVMTLGAELYGYPAPIWLDVAVDGVELRVVCLHLPLARLGSREPVVRELLACDELGGRDAVVVAGDLNAAPDDPLIRSIVEAGFEDVSGACGATVPNPDPVVRLDYLFVRANALRLDDVTADVFGDRPDAEGFLPSDHLAVGATVHLGS